MERPAKRPRVVSTKNQPYYDKDLQLARKQNNILFKSALESIFDRYSQDFTGVGDEIDLQTGQIVVDNGHLEALAQGWDESTGSSEKHIFGEGTGNGHSLLRAITVAPENDDTTRPSSENDPSARLVNAWFKKTGSLPPGDDDSDLDSLRGFEQETASGYDERRTSITRLSSQDSLASDNDKTDSLKASPDQNDSLGCSETLDQRGFRSVSVDSLANDMVTSTNSSHKNVPNLRSTSPVKSVELAWATPDIGDVFSIPAREHLRNFENSPHPFALPSVLSSISRPHSSKSRPSTPWKKRSKSVFSDSSEDPLQE